MWLSSGERGLRPEGGLGGRWRSEGLGQRTGWWLQSGRYREGLGVYVCGGTPSVPQPGKGHA